MADEAAPTPCTSSTETCKTHTSCTDTGRTRTLMSTWATTAPCSTGHACCSRGRRNTTRGVTEEGRAASQSHPEEAWAR